MPPGSEESSDGDDSEATGSTGETSASRRPRDPVLTLLCVIKRALRGIDRLHARLETFPGRVQFGIGVLTFISSAYFGVAIKRAVDSLVGGALRPLLNGFVALSAGVQVTVVGLVLLVVQVTVISEKLTTVVELVEDMAGDEEAATDGGMQTRRVETTGAWARGGAGLGAIFGALFGISTIFGGMVFGAITGNLAEEWSAKRRKRRRMQTKLVRYLLRERIFTPESVERDTVRGWFPANEEGFVVDAIEELLQKDDSPVVQQSEGICLAGDSEAVAYLDRNGGRIPSAFAGPNRPPRPSDASD